MDAERYADIFARAATTGVRDELVKVAGEFTKTALSMDDLKGAMGNPAVQNALIGAGVGGLFGAATGKKKLRSALGYGLLGGLGGLGVSALTDRMGGAEKKPNILAGLATGDRGAVTTGTGNPLAATGLGAAAGGLTGRAAGGFVGDQMAHRENQISRFISEGTGKDKNRFAAPLQTLEKYGPGNAGTPPTAAALRKIKLPADEAARAVETAKGVMGADRLSYLPWRRKAQLKDMVKLIQAESGAATRINPRALANAFDDLPARATSRMPRLGRGAGALLGLLLGGVAGAHANRASVLDAQQQAAGAQ